MDKLVYLVSEKEDFSFLYLGNQHHSSISSAAKKFSEDTFAVFFYDTTRPGCEEMLPPVSYVNVIGKRRHKYLSEKEKEMFIECLLNGPQNAHLIKSN